MTNDDRERYEQIYRWGVEAGKLKMDLSAAMSKLYAAERRVAELEEQLARLSWQLPRLEGNNGGDFLEMQSLGGNFIRLRVGHCCVATDEKIVPVELLTAVLFPVIVGDWHKTLDAIAWPDDFKEQLKASAAAEYRRQADIEDADSANYKTGIGYK